MEGIALASTKSTDQRSSDGAEGKFGTMVALKSQDIVLIPMKSLAGVVRQVTNYLQKVCTAESIGISWGNSL